MCGSDYCKTCTPDAFIIAWTEGRHHTTPRFGDYAQQRVATTIRAATFGRLRHENSAAAMEFPEFLELHPAEVCQSADVAYAYFDRLVARMPDFADYIDKNPRPTWNHGSGKSNRKRRKSANRRWRRDVIHRFLLKGGRAMTMRQMYVLIERDVPAWLIPPEAPVEMARAA